MKTIIKISYLFCISQIFSQVGIGTSTPDFNSDLTLGSPNKGLILNKVNLSSTTDAVTLGLFSASKAGMVVYNTSTIDDVTPGIYINDGLKWSKMVDQQTLNTATFSTNTGWSLTGNSSTNPINNFLGTKDVKPLIVKTNDTERLRVTETGQIAIGTSNPDSSAIVDISSSDKGILIPRVSLASSTDATTISSPATGLIVYNTGAGTLKSVGLLFWDGIQWKKFNDQSTVLGSATLDCGLPSLSPATYTSGVSYSGTLSIAYTSGNGGYYTDPNIYNSTGVTGLTAKLNPGNLNNGNGFITYSVTGIPSASSPNISTFNLSSFPGTCLASVGGTVSSETSSIGYVGDYYGQYTNGIQIGGYNFRLIKRTGFDNATTYDRVNVEFKHNRATDTTFYSYASTMWNGNQYDSTNANAFGIGDARNTNLLTPNTWYGWGEVGFVIGTSMEKRQYILSTDDLSSKTFFRCEFMFVDSTPTTPSGDPYLDAKVIMYIERIRAL